MHKPAREPAPDATLLRHGLRRGAGVTLIVLLALAAFLASLVAALPARVVATYASLPAEINDYSGTVWRGSAQLPGGHAVDWRLDPARSLRAARPAFEVRLTGAGTDLAAQVAPSLTGRAMRIEDARGRLAWPLVAALAPELAFACDLSADVGVPELALTPAGRSGSGGFVAGPGRCRTADGESSAVPALEGRIETREDAIALVLHGAGAPEVPLAEAALTSGDQLMLTLHADGARLIQGMPQGEMTLEYPVGPLPF